MKSTVVIQRATASDAARLSEAAERWFRETFAPDNTAEDMAAYCATAFSPAIQREQLLDPNIDTLLALDSNESLVAYAQLRLGAAPDITVPGPIELWRFYVDGSLHGHGFARTL